MRKSLVGKVSKLTGETWVINPANKKLSMLRNCKHCGKEFYAFSGNVNKGMGWYCCRVCMRRGNGCEPIQKCICKQCGKEFEEFVSRIKDGRGIYCSKKCFNEKPLKHVKLLCQHCGKEYERQAYKQKQLDTGYIDKNYCSNECRIKSKATGQIIVCNNPDCQKEFYIQQCQKSRRFCSPQCMGKAICGPNHHLWKVDKIKREAKEFTDIQKRIIFEKYGHKCAVTGFSRDEIKIHIHHINPIHKGGSNTIENGIPVWVEIHKKIHNEGFDITPYLIKD